MSDLPDGVDYKSLRAAIAWEMVQISFKDGVGNFKPDFISKSHDERLDLLIGAYHKALSNVWSAPTSK
jgi:hypothetical protein